MGATMTGVVEKQRANVLGVGISIVTLPAATERLLEYSRNKTKGYVCCTGVHGIMESRRDASLRRVHNQSLMTVPDGMPVVWSARAQVGPGVGRVYGPDLMLAVMKGSCGSDMKSSHFLYGTTEETLERLKEKLETVVPGLVIVGKFAPPFRPLDNRETLKLTQLVAGCRPDFLWVGMSTPKQERFMAENSARLDATIMVGVGAAFDFHAGIRHDAPGWMQRSGLQWFHRLCQEPRRLGPRYLRNNPAFLLHILLQKTGLRRYPIK